LHKHDYKQENTFSDISSEISCLLSVLKQAPKMLPRSRNDVAVCVAIVAEFFAWLEDAYWTTKLSFII